MLQIIIQINAAQSVEGVEYTDCISTEGFDTQLVSC